MSHFIRYWRGYTRAVVFIVAELVLAGAAEGPQKLQFMEYGTVAIGVVAMAFRYL